MQPALARREVSAWPVAGQRLPASSPPHDGEAFATGALDHTGPIGAELVSNRRRPPRWMPGYLASSCAIAAILIGLSASAASATAVTEAPANDNISQAFGPLANGVGYDGQFESVNDIDWLYFYIGGAKQVQVRVTKVGTGCSSSIAASVRSADGQTLYGKYDNTIESNTTTTFDFNTTIPGRFYVVLGSDCVGDPYKVDVGPPEAVTTVAPAGDERPIPTPQPTSEPNDTIAAAGGPLAPSTAYGGVFSAVNDRDWFVFYTTGAVQTRVAVTKVGAGCSTDIAAAVRDSNGVTIYGKYDDDIDSDTTSEFDFTTTAAGRFYVTLSNDCVGDPYQVRVGPPEAITVTSPLIGMAPTTAPAATPEPNDLPSQATRIVGGISYGASIDTVNDIDWFGFGVKAGRNVDVTITKIGDGCGESVSTSVFKAASTDPGDSLSSTRVDRNVTEHHQFTAETATEYLLRVSGTCPGDPYQLRIDPADAVTVPVPPPPDRDGDGTPDGQDRCPTIAGTASAGCPPKTTPTITIVLLPKRDTHKPFRFRVAGSIRIASALVPVACGGNVTIRFRNGRRSVSKRTAYLRPDCKYGLTVSFKSRRTFPRARRLGVTATFAGNVFLRSASRTASAHVK